MMASFYRFFQFWVDYPFLFIMTIVGTIAFGFSGAGVGIRKNMDIFGVSFLAIVNATGGGIIRDITIGIHPPLIFDNTYFVLIAFLTANIYFWTFYFHNHHYEKYRKFLERAHFWADTLGVASFAVGGAYLGIQRGFGDKTLLLVYMGFMTASGGGILRDIFAGQVAIIFRKRVYALAGVIGSLIVAYGKGEPFFLLLAAVVIIIVRYCAERYRWHLPAVQYEEGK